MAKKRRKQVITVEPKKIECEICKKSVNKRQTIAIGPKKRACKNHPETAKKAEDWLNFIISSKRKENKIPVNNSSPKEKEKPLLQFNEDED